MNTSNVGDQQSSPNIRPSAPGGLLISQRELTWDLYLESCESNPSSQYAILDACDEPKVPILAKNLEENAVSLYRGRADEDLWSIAPYLVKLETNVVNWIREELVGTPFGILLSAATNLETLRKHFRRFLMVKSPEGKSLYFRYYDPRVLPTFLLSSESAEVASFFGPVGEFIVPSEDGTALTGLSRTSR